VISVVVPTHDPRHLKEALGSVLGQTEQDFEVVVVTNGKAVLGGAVPDDPRFRVVPYEGPPYVGAIKRHGFKAAKGSVLVELDHDDLLAPDALREVRSALGGGASFVYSNFAHFRDDGQSPRLFNPYWGWRYRQAEVLGRQVKEQVAFDPTPASIGHIWYAPNHVRAWTRDGYDLVGGHDDTMDV
jgi:glycosyltransferase involved in cell wall biosynthesis